MHLMGDKLVSANNGSMIYESLEGRRRQKHSASLRPSYTHENGRTTRNAFRPFETSCNNVQDVGVSRKEQREV